MASVAFFPKHCWKLRGEAQFSFLTTGFLASPGTVGQAFTLNPLGTSGFPLRKVELTCHLLTHILGSQIALLTAGECLIWQVPLHAFLTSGGKKARRAECWAPLLGTFQLPRAGSSIPSERDGSREHIPHIHKKKIWGI